MSDQGPLDLDAVAHYRIEGEIGRGAVGIVFSAVDESTGRNVALKVLPGAFSLGRNTLARFQREARAAAQIVHPAVVRVLDVGRFGGVHYLVMERLAGPSLRDRLAAEERLDPRVAVDLLLPVAEALVEAHGKGIVHRDITPANLIQRDPDTLCLADFGVAKFRGEVSLTLTGQGMGTPAYISPEQVDGLEADARSDIHALGLVLFEAVTGRRPFEGSSPEQVMRAIRETRLPPASRLASAVPADLAAVIGRATEKQPDARYPTMAELVADLRCFQQGEPTAAQPVGRRRRLLRAVARGIERAGYGQLALLALAGALTLCATIPLRQATTGSLVALHALGFIPALICSLKSVSLGRRRSPGMILAVLSLSGMCLLMVVGLAMRFDAIFHPSYYLPGTKSTGSSHWSAGAVRLLYRWLGSATPNTPSLGVALGLLAIPLAALAAVTFFYAAVLRRPRWCWLLLLWGGLATMVIFTQRNFMTWCTERVGLYVLTVLASGLAGGVLLLGRWLESGGYRRGLLAGSHILLATSAAVVLVAGSWTGRKTIDWRSAASMVIAGSHTQRVQAWLVLNQRDDRLNRHLSHAQRLALGLDPPRAPGEIAVAAGGLPVCDQRCSLVLDLVLTGVEPLTHPLPATHRHDLEAARTAHRMQGRVLRRAIETTGRSVPRRPSTSLQRFDRSRRGYELVSLEPLGVRRAFWIGVERSNVLHATLDRLVTSPDATRRAIAYWLAARAPLSRPDLVRRGLDDRHPWAALVALELLAPLKRESAVELLRQFLARDPHLDASLIRSVGSLISILDRGGAPATAVFDEYARRHRGHRCGFVVELVRMACGANAPIRRVESVLRALAQRAAMGLQPHPSLLHAIRTAVCHAPRPTLRRCLVLLFALGQGEAVAPAWLRGRLGDTAPLIEIATSPTDRLWALVAGGATGEDRKLQAQLAAIELPIAQGNERAARAKYQWLRQSGRVLDAHAAGRRWLSIASGYARNVAWVTAAEMELYARWFDPGGEHPHLLQLVDWLRQPDLLIRAKTDPQELLELAGKLTRLHASKTERLPWCRRSGWENRLAGEVCRKAIEMLSPEDPRQAQARHLLARSLLAHGRITEAIGAVEAAIAGEKQEYRLAQYKELLSHCRQHQTQQEMLKMLRQLRRPK